LQEENKVLKEELQRLTTQLVMVTCSQSQDLAAAFSSAELDRE
jgi:hypothetical protein